MSKKNVLIITYDNYPNGNAGAVRQHIFAKAFMDFGYSVTLIGMGKSTDFQYKNYEGVKYISLRSKKRDLLHRIFEKICFKKRLSSLLENENPQLLLIIDIPLNSMQYLKKYAKVQNVKLIHDSVEWYSKEEFKLGCFDMNYIHKNFLNRFVINRNFTVIAISKYLKEYFSSKDIESHKIPFILDVKNVLYKKNLLQDKIIIVYAGTIGKKDYFDSIIEAMNRLDSSLINRLEFRIIGCDMYSFIKCTNIDKTKICSLGESIVFLGRLPREEVIKNLSEANFTILIRPENLRYAQAGFPTKVTESLTYGTPVIANLTSDIGDYLSDNYNSILVAGNTAEAVLEALNKALLMNKEQLEQMCKNARLTAEEKLDYRVFNNEINKILEVVF